METLFTPHRVINGGDRSIRDGRIAAVGKAADITVPQDYEITDAAGVIVGPGFVDIHCHGGDLYTSHEEPARQPNITCGVSRITCLITILIGMDKAAEAVESGKPQGIFLEGPFNNPRTDPNSGTNSPRV